MAIATVAWPGHMSSDTLAQIDSVRSGRYNDWHAPILSALWRPFFRLGVGPGWVLVASTVTMCVSSYLLLRTSLRRRGAALCTAAIVASPQVLGYLLVLSRDTWFTALLLASFAALATLHRYPRRTLVAVAFAALWLALSSRQNALPAGLVAALAAFDTVGLGQQLATRVRALRGPVARVGFRLGAAVVVLLSILGTQWVARAAIDVERRAPEQALYIYDLANLSVRARRVLFSPSVYPAQDLDLLERRTNVYSVNPLLFGDGAPIPFPVPPSALDDLRRDWRHAVKTYPVAYSRIRWKQWTRQIGWSGNTWWIYHPEVDSNSWGYKTRFDSIDDGVGEYVEAFASNDNLDGGVVHRVWVYMTVNSLAALLLFSRESRRRTIGWLNLAVLAYAATFFVGAMGVQYRFSYPNVVVALLSLPAIASAVRVLPAQIAARRQTKSTASSKPETVMSGDVG